MSLEQEQQNLFQEIATAIANDQDITPILEKIETKENFLAIFKHKTAFKVSDTLKCESTLLSGSAIKKSVLVPVLNAAKEKNALQEFVTEIDFINFKEREEKVEQEVDEKVYEATEEYFLLIDLITKPKLKLQLMILGAIKESCGLEAFWKVISENDRDNIKAALEREKDKCDNEGEKYKYQAALEKVTQAEKSMADEKSSETDVEAKNKQKAIVVGSIFYVIAAIAAVGVISTYFPIGTLPPLAIIGIAFAAGLVAGLVTGGITYAISKPSNELEKVDAQPKVCPGADVMA